MLSRCAEGTTYLNIPAKAEHISYHDDINQAVEARCSPLPKPTEMMQKTLNDLTDLGFDFFIEIKRVFLSSLKSYRFKYQAEI